MKLISSIVLATALLCATAGPLVAADAGVEQAFDRNEGSIYALHGRALRENPELNDPDLEARLVERIKLFRFPPRKTPTTVVKPIEFFPAV